MMDDINSRQAEIQSAVEKELELQSKQLEQLKAQQPTIKQQLPKVLQSNYELTTQTNQYPYISFQFENLPGVKMECGVRSDAFLYERFYSDLIDDYLRHHLRPLKSTIIKSKLFISSKSVLDGEWVQIQGDGAVLEMKNERLYSFIKPGDDLIPYTECDQHCGNCDGLAGKTIQLRHLIKFKWE
jgi:hypothetical protein